MFHFSLRKYIFKSELTLFVYVEVLLETHFMQNRVV